MEGLYRMEAQGNLQKKKADIGISCAQERKYQGGQLITKFELRAYYIQPNEEIPHLTVDF